MVGGYYICCGSFANGYHSDSCVRPFTKESWAPDKFPEYCGYKEDDSECGGKYPPVIYYEATNVFNGQRHRAFLCKPCLWAFRVRYSDKRYGYIKRFACAWDFIYTSATACRFATAYMFGKSQVGLCKMHMRQHIYYGKSMRTWEQEEIVEEVLQYILAQRGECIPTEQIYKHIIGGNKTHVTTDMVDYALGNNTYDRETDYHDLWVPGRGIKRHHFRRPNEQRFDCDYYFFDKELKEEADKRSEK